MAIWLQNALRTQVVMLVVLLVLFFITPLISASIAGAIYPEKELSFTESVSDFFTGEKNQQTQLKENKKNQIQFVFIFFGSGAILMLFILDTPRVLNLGYEQANKQLEQARTLITINPELSRTLTDQANRSLSYTAPPEGSSLPARPFTDIEATCVRSSPVEALRYAGAENRYRIDSAIASGGSGAVYAAYDTTLDRKVALKELLEKVDLESVEAKRFLVEAKALAALSHPNIISVYDMFKENGHYWIVMELLTGGDLGEKIAQKGKIPLNESIAMIKSIADGLSFAHAQGFIHRDIKPGNLLFAENNSLRIIDFGIAKNSNSIVKTQVGCIMGSPGYMSPEQAAGDPVDQRSDIYSLGITFYKMLTGELPFTGNTADVMAKQITQQPAPPSLLNDEIPRQVESIILKMLEKQPGKRFQNCEELLSALNGIS